MASVDPTVDPATAPLRPVRLARPDTRLEHRPDGAIVMRSPTPLGVCAPKITARLEHWAETAPDRVFLAQRTAAGPWRELTYANALAQVRSIATALLRRDLSPERPIAILSGNDIEHALLALAAMFVGIPYAPISPPYSLMSKDFGRLRAIIENLTPGLVFLSDGALFAHAIEATVPFDVEVVTCANPLASRFTTAFAELILTEPKEAVDLAHAHVTPDTVAKILFTSGSTGTPKGVINTQRMLCANQAMIRAGLCFLGDEPPVLVDWLPWNHTFGGNHNFNLALDNGGTLYIDDGRPLPGAIAETARNLADISPTIYFNVPKGFEALLPHLHSNRALRENFFRRLQVMFYAGAGLAQHVWDAYARMSVETTGERIVFLSSCGSTETSPLALSCHWDFDRPGNIGLPAPGVELKLLPKDGKLEARLKGPNVTPGYWRDARLTAEAFDEEYFYKIGDALKFVDPAVPVRGLLFDGRLAEDFKLASGTWVNTGALRAHFVNHCAPLVRDAVIAGADRAELTALVFPDADACRALSRRANNETLAAVLADPAVRSAFQQRLATLAQQSQGSSTRICRMILLDDAPSLDVGEVTDKGSINQRTVLVRRAPLIDELYTRPWSDRVISVDPATTET